MPAKVLTNDLNNCLINFDRKVIVTNLLDEYGGLLEEIARTVDEFLSSEEAKGKKFQKTFLLRGVRADSENEIVTLVSEEKLKQREKQLKHAHSMLYSVETVGGSKSPPTEFVPLKHISVKLESLEVKDVAKPAAVAVVVKEEKQQPAKKTGAIGAMFKKQQSSTLAAKSPEKKSPNNSEPEKKSGALTAMFKKQEAIAGAKKSPNLKPEKKSSTLGAMFKKQESTASKSSPEGSKNATTNIKSGTTKDRVKESKLIKKKDAKKPKEEPPPTNTSVNLFQESSSSDDEETLDKLKSAILTDDEEDKPSTSKKRRRILDSDDEETAPEAKVERKEEVLQVIEIDDEPQKSAETFMDEDGFIVTVKAKNKKPAVVRRQNPRTPVKVKKESPKSAAKKEVASKTPAAKTKQGNIMSFFTKK